MVMKLLIGLLAAVLLWPAGAAGAVQVQSPGTYCRVSEVGDRVRADMGTFECVRVDKERPRWRVVDTPYTRRAALRFLMQWPEVLGPQTFGDLCRRYDRKPAAVRWYTVDAFDTYYPASVMLPVSKELFAAEC